MDLLNARVFCRLWSLFVYCYFNPSFRWIPLYVCNWIIWKFPSALMIAEALMHCVSFHFGQWLIAFIWNDVPILMRERRGGWMLRGKVVWVACRTRSLRIQILKCFKTNNSNQTVSSFLQQCSINYNLALEEIIRLCKSKAFIGSFIKQIIHMNTCIEKKSKSRIVWFFFSHCLQPHKHQYIHKFQIRLKIIVDFHH